MSFELINLTLPLVIQEIEDVLDEYPEHPYQSAFSMHEFRQKLIAHVLSQVPNQYAIAGEQTPARKPSSRHSSLFSGANVSRNRRSREYLAHSERKCRSTD